MIHKNRGNRRFMTKTKAKRREQLSKYLFGGWSRYEHFGQYRKGKIHCSCPICRAKTNHRKMIFSGGNRSGNNWKPSDRRKIDAMAVDDIYRKEVTDE